MQLKMTSISTTFKNSPNKALRHYNDKQNTDFYSIFILDCVMHLSEYDYHLGKEILV